MLYLIYWTMMKEVRAENEVINKRKNVFVF